VDAFAERFTGDAAEEGGNTDVAGGNRDDAGEEEDQREDGRHQNENFGADSPQIGERGHIAARTEIDGGIWHDCLRCERSVFRLDCSYFYYV